MKHSCVGLELFVRLLASNKIGDGKRCSSLVFLILLTFKMNRFLSCFTMESIFNDNCSMLVVNMFFHGGNHMYKSTDDKSFVRLNGKI